MVKGNKARDDILKEIVDTILINNKIRRIDLESQTGISTVTVKKWMEIIETIQSLPKIEMTGTGKNQIIVVQAPSSEQVLAEKAVAFLSSIPIEELSEE